MIVRHLSIILLAYTFLVLQSSLGSDLAFHGFRPWLPGIALVACVTFFDGAAGICWAALLGLGVDCLSSERLGVNVIAATIVATGILFARSNNRNIGPISVAAYLLAGTIAWRLMSASIQGALAHRTIDGSQIFLSAFGDAVFSVILTTTVLLFVRLIRNTILPQRTAAPVSLTNQWSMLTR